MAAAVKAKQLVLLRRLAAYGLDVIMAIMLAMTVLLWIYPRFFPNPWGALNGSVAAEAGVDIFKQLAENNRTELLGLFAATQFTVLATFTIYFWLSEIIGNGGSLGKRMLRLRVVDFTAKRRPDSLRLFLRSAMSSTCLTVCSPFLLPNFLCALFRRDRRCFHDIVSGTNVVCD